MKKSILGLSLILSLIALVLSGYVSYRMDVTPSLKGDKSAYVDSLVLESVQNTVNPLFGDVEEVILFQEKSLEGEQIDVEFNQMPEETLRNVATVCIKREGCISKRGIIYEYRANRSVYDNLPQGATPSIETSIPTGSKEGNPVTSVDSSKVPIGETRYTQHDTIIGGKTYKMKTKTDVTYE